MNKIIPAIYYITKHIQSYRVHFKLQAQLFNNCFTFTTEIQYVQTVVKLINKLLYLIDVFHAQNDICSTCFSFEICSSDVICDLFSVSKDETDPTSLLTLLL